MTTTLDLENNLIYIVYQGLGAKWKSQKFKLSGGVHGMLGRRELNLLYEYWSFNIYVTPSIFANHVCHN